MTSKSCNNTWKLSPDAFSINIFLIFNKQNGERTQTKFKTGFDDTNTPPKCFWFYFLIVSEFNSEIQYIFKVFSNNLAKPSYYLYPSVIIALYLIFIELLLASVLSIA